MNLVLVQLGYPCQIKPGLLLSLLIIFFFLKISSAQGKVRPESKELVHSVSATISKALVSETFINCRADDNAITLSTKKQLPMYCKWYANVYIQKRECKYCK